MTVLREEALALLREGAAAVVPVKADGRGTSAPPWGAGGPLGGGGGPRP